MDNRSETPLTTLEATKPTELPPLPFTYVRTDDVNSAQYQEWRVSPVSFAGKPNEPRPDEQLVEMVRRDHEGKQWYTSEHWRKKGVPHEQVELQIGEDQITVYNWNKDKPFTDEHAQKTLLVFQQLSARFPDLKGKVRWILIDDVQQPSAFGDPEKYPLNGYAMNEWQAFRLFPRGTETMPHRIKATSNFEGTVVHEMTHLIQRQFEEEWSKDYKWEFCMDYPDDWELRATPDGKDRKWFNKQTGEMSPQAQFSLQPDECVTYYARQNMGEDICDSMVSYTYDPEQLKTISEKKFEIMKAHDAQQEPAEVSSKRVPSDQIKLPDIPEQTINYYIKEPDQASNSDFEITIK